jgi:hypothetical protein
MNNIKINYPAISLVVLMAATRIHHFGGAFTLPDASLAVFFLAGLGLGSPYFLALLLLQAGLMDYLAISQFQVSGWCISPAYVFLIPTYAVLWLAGRYCSRFKILNVSELMTTLLLLTLSTTAAFIISNTSFYLFSGRYGDLAFGQYVASIMQYYLPYLTSALFYGVLALIVIRLFKSMPSLVKQREV